jgi:hypothetical protein
MPEAGEIKFLYRERRAGDYENCGSLGCRKSRHSVNTFSVCRRSASAFCVTASRRAASLCSRCIRREKFSASWLSKSLSILLPTRRGTAQRMPQHRDYVAHLMLHSEACLIKPRACIVATLDWSDSRLSSRDRSHHLTIGAGCVRRPGQRRIAARPFRKGIRSESADPRRMVIRAGKGSAASCGILSGCNGEPVPASHPRLP